MYNITENMHGRKFFKVLGLRGFVALRKYKSRGIGLQLTKRTKQIHLGKFSMGVGDYYFAN